MRGFCVWDMSLTACLFAWVIVLALKLRDEPNTKQWLLFGTLWGLIALSNSLLLAFLPFCALWIIYRRPGAPSQSALSIEMGS